MSRPDRPTSRGFIAILALAWIAAGSPTLASEPGSARQDYGTDPASVRRFGPAYRYPQAGWVVLHIEGKPYDRGYQHGRLMALEIADYVKTLAQARSLAAPEDGWKSARTLVDALFLRRYDKESLEEMKGIADGASAGGATFDSRGIDLVDIVAINSDMELGSLDDALEAQANGLEGKVFRKPASGPAQPKKAEHCSAFAATGPATADGKIVIGHITMWSLPTSRFYNVWLDVKPEKGHRVLMQSYPGGIQSGMDYYQNDDGLIVVETTIGQTRFDPDGEPLASRIRRALQYGRSIDDVVAILSEKNNGLYSNEWLLGDTKTNEIAMFELGTGKTKLWRSGKSEWFGGTEGFYWGCNNAKDVDVRLETIPSVEGKPANIVWKPSDRDRAWQSLYREQKGKIGVDLGFRAFTTPPLASSSSLDAKFTTTGLSKDLKNWAMFGPPMGRAWQPSEEERNIPGIKPLVSNDWTLLNGDAPAPAAEDARPAIDLSGLSRGAALEDAEGRAPAWHGTILPKADADAWLATAFADYEAVVGLETPAHLDDDDDGPSSESRDAVDLALFHARSRYLAATRRLGRDVPLSRLRAVVDSADWYEIAAGKGVLLLAALRSAMGPIPFAAMMDDFGRSHAGQAVSTAQFRDHVAKAAGSKLPGDFFARWLDETGLPGNPSGGTWAVDSFEDEPEKALIVYGTGQDVHANKEAAARLQRAIAVRWSNVVVPIQDDASLTDDDWKSHHVLLVGRPSGNSAAARASKGLSVPFGLASFILNGETYAHPGTALIVAGENPFTPRFGVVLFAGLGAESTWKCVEEMGSRRSGHAEAILIADGNSPRPLIVRRSEK